MSAAVHKPMRVGDSVNVRVEGHPEPVLMLAIHLDQPMNAGGGIALITLRSPESDGLARLMAAAPELMALLVEARTQLPVAAASWNEDEHAETASFHVKHVLDLIQSIDGVIAKVGGAS